MAEQAHGRKEEQPPAAPPEFCILAIYLAQDFTDLRMGIVEILQPLPGGVFVVHAIPAPVLLDVEEVGKLPDEIVAGHHAAGKEMLRDPVRLVVLVESVGGFAM